MTSPRHTGYSYPAEDPKYANDGPDEPNWPQWRWDEWRAERQAREDAWLRAWLAAEAERRAS